MTEWPTFVLPPLKLYLTKQSVHIWQIDLNQSEQIADELYSLLSLDEQQKTDRFHFPRHRRRSIIARANLRIILAKYLNLEPAELSFTYAEHGKPEIKNTINLEFNLSHSHELALLAITEGMPIGIDLEYRRPERAGLEIAQRFFSTEEYETLKSLPAAQHCEAFFNAWTRKEAFIKAIGQGLSYPLDDFAVTLSPQEPACLIQIKGDASAAKQWTMLSFELDRYQVACTTEQPLRERAYFLAATSKKKYAHGNESD